jgi:hypothetical protein
MFIFTLPLETITYINNQLNSGLVKEDKVMFYKNILRCIDKFGFDRLISLANQHRTRILSRYKEPIKFKSLNFKGRSRMKTIVGYNKNYNSVINSFITLSWLTRGKALTIPDHLFQGLPRKHQRVHQEQ